MRAAPACGTTILFIYAYVYEYKFELIIRARGCGTWWKCFALSGGGKSGGTRRREFFTTRRERLWLGRLGSAAGSNTQARRRYLRNNLYVRVDVANNIFADSYSRQWTKNAGNSRPLKCPNGREISGRKSVRRASAKNCSGANVCRFRTGHRTLIAPRVTYRRIFNDNKSRRPF